MTMGTPTRNRLPPHPPSNSASASSFTDNKEHTIGYSSHAIGTPNRQPNARRSLRCGGAQRKVRRGTMGLAPESKSKPFLPPSYSATSNEHTEVEETINATRETAVEPESFSQGSIDSVEGTAMKSRIQAIKKIIDNLVREKIELSISRPH